MTCTPWRPKSLQPRHPVLIAKLEQQAARNLVKVRRARRLLLEAWTDSEMSRPPVDATKWTRPTPDELREVIDASGLSHIKVSRRLGVGERRVRYWIDPRARETRRITYCEHRALLDLLAEEKGGD